MGSTQRYSSWCRPADRPWRWHGVLTFKEYLAGVFECRWACGGSLVEAMWKRVGTCCQARVRNIHDCFSEGREIWWAFGPSHGQSQRKCHQRLFIVSMRESHTQLGYISRRNVDSVEPVSDVDLQEVDRAIVGVGEADLAENALESMTKLHGFAGSKASGVGIHVGEGVVDDSPWAAVSLGDHSHWRDSQAR
jgi:hypothetical protein